MPGPVNGRAPVRALLALATASARYWLTVAPNVRRELRHWARVADAIGDPHLRGLALTKLDEAGAHAQITATLATIAPRRSRAKVITAIVALEVMYDYLDAVTEQPARDVLTNSLCLNQALGAPFASPSLDVDYFAHSSHSDDGYLESLVATCKAAVHSLPAFAAVATVARETAERCGMAQARSHAVIQLGAAQLADWASQLTTDARLLWWETAAGAAASVLALHVLIASAADPRMNADDARRISEAYLPICAMITLLDSTIDRQADAAAGSHCYVSYYATPPQAAERIATVTREATLEAATLPRASHHVMTIAGAAAYYLSAPEADTETTRIIANRVTKELQPLVTPILAIFHVWRWANGTPASTARMPRARRRCSGVWAWPR